MKKVLHKNTLQLTLLRKSFTFSVVSGSAPMGLLLLLLLLFILYMFYMTCFKYMTSIFKHVH